MNHGAGICTYNDLQSWVIFRVNVGKYHIQGASGNNNKNAVIIIVKIKMIIIIIMKKKNNNSNNNVKIASLG